MLRRNQQRTRQPISAPTIQISGLNAVTIGSASTGMLNTRSNVAAGDVISLMNQYIPNGIQMSPITAKPASTVANLIPAVNGFDGSSCYSILEKSGAGANPNRITSRSPLYR
jgi:hypothetical protein